jgi:hypothetical protein
MSAQITMDVMDSTQKIRAQRRASRKRWFIYVFLAGEWALGQRSSWSDMAELGSIPVVYNGEDVKKL